MRIVANIMPLQSERIVCACSFCCFEGNCLGVANLLSCRVVQLILAGSLETVLNTGILPQGLDGVANFWWEVVALNLLWLHEDGLNVVFGSLVVKWEL